MPPVIRLAEDYEAATLETVHVNREEITDVAEGAGFHSQIEMTYDLDYLFRDMKCPWVEDAGDLEDGEIHDDISTQDAQLKNVRLALQDIFLDLRNSDSISVADQSKTAIARLLGGDVNENINKEMLKKAGDESVISYIPKALVYALYQDSQWVEKVISEKQLSEVLTAAAINARGAPLLAGDSSMSFKFQFVENDSIKFNLKVVDEDQQDLKYNANIWQFVIHHVSRRTHVSGMGPENKSLKDGGTPFKTKDWGTKFQLLSSGNVYPTYSDKSKFEEVTVFTAALEKEGFKITVKSASLENTEGTATSFSDYVLFRGGSLQDLPVDMPLIKLPLQLREVVDTRLTMPRKFNVDNKDDSWASRPNPKVPEMEKEIDGMLKVYVAPTVKDEDRIVYIRHPMAVVTQVKEGYYASAGFNFLIESMLIVDMPQIIND